MVARITHLEHGFEPSNLILSVLSVTLLPQLRIHFLFSFSHFLLHSDVPSPPLPVLSTSVGFSP